MKKTSLIVLLFILCLQIFCNDKPQGVIPQDINMAIVKDTIVEEYFIDGISSEGTGAIVKYVDGKILESLIEIYDEMGQAKINYFFLGDSVKVNEKQYNYKPHYFMYVESADDIILDKEFNYYLDMDGNIIGSPVDDRIDIFKEFKETVPFELGER